MTRTELLAFLRKANFLHEKKKLYYMYLDVEYILYSIILSVLKSFLHPKL